MVLEDRESPVVVCEGISYAYPSSDADQPVVEALRGVTLSVERGERLGILGPNGGGKSTLVKIILGVLTPKVGRVLVFGEAPVRARKSGRIGYVPQRSEAELSFPLSVRQVVEMAASVGLSPWKRLGGARCDAVDRAMDLTGAAAFAHRHIGSLSGGQVQRAMVARALAGSPGLLLLDEPTVGIDPAGQQQFAEMLGRLQRELGITVIVVSHDLRTIAAGCDRVACLSRTLHYHKAPSGLTPAVLAEVFRHDVSAIFGDVHVDAHSAADCRVNHGASLTGHHSHPRHTPKPGDGGGA